jgi:hypothetical protein
VRFRGFYYEIVVSNNEINLHAIITSQIVPQKEQAVDLTISHWISFDH